MNTLETVFLSILGLLGGAVFLYYGAEGLVKGSASVAIRRGITPLVVGLTIVAFGTSSPELVVSVSAAIRGNAAIAFGNVIGSNICNIALILGISALITPIKVNLQLIKFDILIMIGVTLLLVIMILDSNLGRLDGVILFAGIIAYNIFTMKHAKEEKLNNDELIKRLQGKTWKDFFLILGGLVVLVIGANLFITGAIKIAKLLNVSDVIIGLSVVAIGTSLPELATSVVAAVKKQGDISIGNIVGSNIFNILCILGVAAIIQPIILTGANQVNHIDIGVFIIISIILLPLAWTKLELSRLEGAFLLFLYIGYMYYMYTYRLTEISHYLKGS
ncbi:sodium:calcium antiporter [Bacteroidetes/Chlorobi group bacterium ChocPot_Mid]|nr:MAG: sodium:calcium antiporter [Bacteroidetes/Chlorobi group bacterium ChocPot_Mid]